VKGKGQEQKKNKIRKIMSRKPTIANTVVKKNPHKKNKETNGSIPSPFIPAFFLFSIKILNQQTIEKKQERKQNNNNQEKKRKKEKKTCTKF
jgi:hypothetical protein